MPETVTEKREASINYDALSEMGADFGVETPAPIEQKQEVVAEQKDPNEIIQEGEAAQAENKDVKTEAEVKTDAEAKLEGEAKTEGEAKLEEKAEGEVKADEFELKVEHVDGFKKPAEDGTWAAVGELLEVDVAEESPEAVLAAVKAKYEPLIEEARKYGLEQEYSKLKPETVTALKLIEMGYPEEQAFNPTAKHAELLKLDDAALIRTNLEGQEGWDEERVELEMESLSQNPTLLKHEALKLKEWLTNDAKRISSEREALVNEYTQNKDNVALQQKELEQIQVKEAMMSLESFMGAKLNPEAKSAMSQKYSRGDYGDVLKDGKSIAEYIYFKEFGSKILDETKKSSYAKGKEEYAKQMLGIPPRLGEVSGQKVQEKLATNNQKSKADEVLGEDFG